MTLPTMAGGLDRATTMQWCRRIDEGPYRSLAVGERVTFDNLDMFAALAFAAAATERVRIVPSLVVLPMHPAVMVAKQLATLDVLSDGRLTVVLGVGSREHDFASAERPMARLHATLDEQVEVLRSVWRGEVQFDGAEVIGPLPQQGAELPLLSGSMGPKGMARAAKWADGVMGFSTAPDTEDWPATFAKVTDAWTAAGRVETPWRATSFWFSLQEGPEAEERLKAYARRYMNIFGPAVADFMVDQCTAAGPANVAVALDRLEAAGCDELFLVPTSADPRELDRLAALVG